MEARGAAVHPTIHRTTPTTKNHPAQNINSAKVEAELGTEVVGVPEER